MTLTLTLGQLTLHTIMLHSSTSTYLPNVIEIEETFRGWAADVQRCTDGCMDGHLRPTLLGRLGRVNLKIYDNVALIFLCTCCHWHYNNSSNNKSIYYLI